MAATEVAIDGNRVPFFGSRHDSASDPVTIVVYLPHFDVTETLDYLLALHRP